MNSVYSIRNGEDVITCLGVDGQTFLMGGVDGALQVAGTNPTFSDGGCCPAMDASEGCAATCAEGSGFCASKAGGLNPINNSFLRKFMWPSDSSNCDSNSNIEIGSTGSATIKKHDFSGVLPNSGAVDWHCKWKISASDSLVSVPATGAGFEATTIASREANGWLQVEVVPVGFDNDVIVVMQSPEALNDYNFRDITNNPAKASYVGKSSYGRKYVFPAEYDIFIDVSPYKYKTNSEEQPTADGGGNVQIKVTHLTTNPTPASDAADYRSWSEVKRIEALAGAEVAPAPVDPDADDLDNLAPVDDSELPGTKKDFDGNVVS